LGTVTVTGGAAAQTYEVVNNVSDSHPYRSLLMYIETQDVAVTMSNFKIHSDDVLSIAKADDF
jgi:PP-loop superfamily ATP-utilizing enzyme